MKKIIVIFLIAVIYLLVLLVIISERSFGHQEYQMAVVRKENRRLKNTLASLEGDAESLVNKVIDLSDDLSRANNFYGLLDKVRPEEYNRGYNNCYDYSKRLRKLLSFKGIGSSIFIAKGRTHAWLGVHIEATTGKFIKPENMLSVLEIRDDKQKVSCACR